MSLPLLYIQKAPSEREGAAHAQDKHQQESLLATAPKDVATASSRHSLSLLYVGGIPNRTRVGEFHRLPSSSDHDLRQAGI